MKNAIEFINKYYSKDDIFQIGIKDHITVSKSTGEKGVFYSGKNNFFQLPMTAREEEFLRSNNKKDFSMYFTLNTFKEKTNRKESNIRSIKGIFFDADYDGANFVKKIEDALGTASIKINSTPSMDKWQLIYLFDKEFTNEKQFTKIKAISKALTEHFGTDSTFDLSRYCRLPFTNNGKVNEESELVIFNENMIYSPQYLLKYCNTNKLVTDKEESAQVVEKKVTDLTGSAHELSLKKWNFKFNLEELQEKYDDLDVVCTTPSETDYNLISLLIREYRYGDEKIKTIMLKISESKKPPQKKLEDFARCIYKIRGKMNASKHK